jgi:putative SOS response-associated peptidase YedK
MGVTGAGARLSLRCVRALRQHEAPCGGSCRALQIADGYFEWLKPEKRGEPRQPFFFQVDGGELFAFAAIWAPAKIEGEWIHSLAMLTCNAAPNRVAARIHNRMPVILADRDVQRDG